MIFIGRKERDRLQEQLVEEMSQRQAAENRAREAEKQLADFQAKPTLYCSFCGKSQHVVRKLIAGPTVFICNECVDLSGEILKERPKT